MKKMKKKQIFIIAGIILVVGLMVIVNLKRSGKHIIVQTEKVTRGVITETVSGSAKIQPEVQVNISAKVSGQITNLGVAEGDPVKKGDFLVQLDPEYYRAAVKQSNSNLAYAEAGFEKAKSEYDRYKKLHNDNLASLAELEIAKSTYEQMKASVEQAKAALEQANDDLSKTTIYAPMDGIVSQLNKKVGEMAMGSQFTLDVIMTVADLSRMQAEADIDENDVVNVEFGDTTLIHVDAFPDTTFKGIVTEIANTGTTQGSGTQEEVTNFLVKIAMIEKPERVRPGMSATVDITTESKTNVLKVPIQCVTMREPVKAKDQKKGKKEDQEEASSEAPATPSKPGKVLFVVKEGILKQAAVETGISSDTEWEITSGTEENDEVVSGPFRLLSKTLKDGDAIKVDNSAKNKMQENRE